MLVHSAGDTRPIQWPHGAPCLYKVERWCGAYVAIYSDRSEADARARKERGYYDARVLPIFRTS